MSFNPANVVPWRKHESSPQVKARQQRVAASSLRDDRRQELSAGSICILQMIVSPIVGYSAYPIPLNLQGSNQSPALF